MVVDLTQHVRWQPRGVAGSTVLAPSGELTRRNYSRFRDDLIRFAVEQPRAVIVSVDRLRGAAEPFLAAVSAARIRVRTWPGVPIVPVCSPALRRAQLCSLTAGRIIPIFDSVATALGSVGPARHGRRLVVELTGSASAARARRCVDETIRDRASASARGDAQLITTELVDNALAHAGGPIRLHLEEDERSLTVAVTDDEPRHPILRERDGVHRVGNGLHVVAQLATAWGSVPRWPTGKVVWAGMAVAPVGLMSVVAGGPVRS